jgi:hypothetical protein
MVKIISALFNFTFNFSIQALLTSSLIAFSHQLNEGQKSFLPFVVQKEKQKILEGQTQTQGYPAC